MADPLWRSGYRRVSLIFVMLVGGLQGAEPRGVQAVGLVLNSNGASLRRADAKSTQQLNSGEILLPGDTISAGPGQAVALDFCPSKVSLRLQAGGEILFSDKHYKAKGPVTSLGAVPSCELPLVRRDNNSGFEYGLSLEKTLQPMGQPAGTLASRVAALTPEARVKIQAELPPIDSGIAANPADAAASIARASVLQRYGLNYDASLEYRRASDLLKKPEWLASVLNDTTARGLELPPRRRLNGPLPGKTYALVVGISQFGNLDAANQLQYADQDAISFAEYLRSERGGSLRDESELRLLTNDRASRSAIENGMSSFLVAQATPDDTVILFVASHGVIEPKSGNGYMLASDSYLQRLPTTAIALASLMSLLDSSQSQAGRVLIFVDVCHAAHIGDFPERLGGQMEKILGSGKSGVFAFSASRPGELAKEDSKFGGGHGAFSYFLLRGLNTSEPIAETDPQPQTVSLDLLIEYVRGKVREATHREQTPTESGPLDRSVEIVADVRKRGIDPGDYPAALMARAMPPRERGVVAGAVTAEYEAALAEGHILPGEPGSAFDLLYALRQELSGARVDLLVEENRLRVALENAGQRVLVQYLKGEDVAQNATDFRRGAAAFAAAFQMTPEAHPLQAQALFCEGRAAVAERRYNDATRLLEKSVRLQPEEAYAWNALGIAWLEQADYQRAGSCFEDAIRRAPYWAYPRHNLALALREQGKLAEAMQQLRGAIDMAHDYAYLHYNLGLLLETMNDRAGAEREYTVALALSKTNEARARVLIAQGTLAAQDHREAKASDLFAKAEALGPDLNDRLALRFNRALLLPNAQAESLLRENLRESPEHMPSLVALAEKVDTRDAWSAVLKVKPGYVAARARLAELSIAAGQRAEAKQILEDGLSAAPRQTRLLGLRGDLQRAENDTAGATRSYCGALVSGAEVDAAARIRGELKKLGVRLNRAGVCP